MNAAPPSRPAAADRRHPDALLVLVESIDTRLRAMDGKLERHMATEPEEWAAALSGLMAKAFPGGDADGHREAHEAQMQAVRDRAAFWRAMLTEVSKYGILGVLGWTAYTLWVAFLKGPG